MPVNNLAQRILLKSITVFSFVILPGMGIAQQKAFKYPFENHTLSFEKRVDDLVGRLTLEEKVSQMLNAAPAIKRLGIPAYDWWNETLHGVARTPFPVTVYPQAIAMAATFDPEALFKMADYSALEGRAIYNKAVKLGRTNERYLGLTYWTPNINIFRDPRWGRGQETYGEDPYLTAVLGDYFVRGLQGNDPRYLKAAACAKHYAVHSGPEPLRHVFNVDVSAHDLWDTYLPAFKKLVVNSKVAGVMCAYNAFRTSPCCASDILMTNILRNQWNFKGYVTSDCWAIDDFFKNHKTHENAEAASADAVLHGTDLDCGTDAYKALVNAVKNGRIEEKQIDISVKRLFMIRFRLGMFDPVSMVKYARTSDTVLESGQHKAHALEMAQKSIVLLKNQDRTLPLSKTLKKIVVLGPNADNAISILGNYNGVPSKLSTVLQGIRDKVGTQTQVVYEKAINFTNDTLLQYGNQQDNFSINGKKGFLAEYFNNATLTGTPSEVRQETNLNHLWQEGEKVTENISANHFSARYTTGFKASADSKVSLELEADDGYRLFVNGKLVLDAWSRNRWGARVYNLDARKDSTYHLKVEYWQGEGKANVRLTIGELIKTDFDKLAQKHQDADAFVFVGGISPQLEGEEMSVNYPGFNGGDRTTINLPEIQTKLMKRLHATGKKVVFVMMTGSAIAIPWEAEHLPAIVNAWYGGQSAGTAVANVLFGDYNPSGRLPITFYKGDEDLAGFDNYSMKNRTYRYFKGKPLFGFGFGLSYSNFKYEQLAVKKLSVNKSQLTVKLNLTNKGTLAGEEVVQLYLMPLKSNELIPIKSLKRFTRYKLKAGETKAIQFTLNPEDLTYIDENGSAKKLTGEFKIFVAGSQPEDVKREGLSSIEKQIRL